jgi:pentatricopeptide repeat protein
VILGVGALFRFLLRGYCKLGRLGGLLLLFDRLIVSSVLGVMGER